MLAAQLGQREEICFQVSSLGYDLGSFNTLLINHRYSDALLPMHRTDIIADLGKSRPGTQY